MCIYMPGGRTFPTISTAFPPSRNLAKLDQIEATLFLIQCNESLRPFQLAPNNFRFCINPINSMHFLHFSGEPQK